MKWMQFAFFWFLDVALSAAIAQFAPPYEKWSLFFLSMAVFWLLPTVLGAWTLIKFWIAYHLFTKRRLVRYFKAKMHENKFPASAGHFDHMTYLSFVLDEDSDLKAKMKAAFFVGELTTYKESKPFTMGIAAQSAFEVAMEEYRPDR